MTTIKADSGREEENNNRMTFCGGYGGQNANNISSGSPSEESMGPRETINCGRVFAEDNDLYASVIGSDNKFNDNESNPILANRPNDINGMTNNSLTGGSYKIASMSKDSSSGAIDTDKPLNNNSITAMTSSDASSIRIDKNRQERNSDGCIGGQTYAYLTISGSPGSSIPTFTDGGCGCWVSTNADLTLIAGAIGGLTPLIQKIPGFSKGAILRKWQLKMDDILTTIDVGGAANFEKAYKKMQKLKDFTFSRGNRIRVETNIRKQMGAGIKNADGTLAHPVETVMLPSGKTQVMQITPDMIGKGNFKIVRPKGSPNRGNDEGFEIITTTAEHLYDVVATERFNSYEAAVGKYFRDMEDAKRLQGFGSQLGDKMKANLTAILAEYTGCFFGGLVGGIGVALGVVTIWRAKVCLGQGMSLDENCQCVCAEGWEKACGSVSSSVWSNYANKVTTFFGGLAGAVIFAGDEIQHCSLGCCSGQTQITNDDGTCDCEDPDAPSVFIQGNKYSTTGCNCKKKVSSSITGIPPATIPGIYMDGDVKTQMENVGKVFNSDTCVFECPVGSDVREGRAKPTLARYTDNLDDASVPTKEYYLYQTGCNFVCDGRDYGGTWPPTCSTGYSFDTTKSVCECVPTCTTADDNFDVIFQCNTSACGEGGGLPSNYCDQWNQYGYTTYTEALGYLNVGVGNPWEADPNAGVGTCGGSVKCGGTNFAPVSP